MKIKITETQAKRLNLISEDINPLSEFEHISKVTIERVNMMYSKLTVLSMNEIINKEVDLGVINNTLNVIEHTYSTSYKKAFDFLEGKEEINDDKFSQIDDQVMGKLNSLQLVAMELESLQESIIDRNLSGYFNDIKSIEIN